MGSIWGVAGSLRYIATCASKQETLLTFAGLQAQAAVAGCPLRQLGSCSFL